MNEATVYADLVKVETPKDEPDVRIVHARISDETVDLDGQIADYNWLKEALPDWFKWGNVRDMHQARVVGKGKALTDVPDQRAYDGELRISDPLAVRNLDEELYSGVSIGIKGPRVINEKGANVPSHSPGRIVGGKIVEVSLVDHPANESCKLIVAKAATAKGPLELTEAEPVELDKAAEPEVEKVVEPEAQKDVALEGEEAVHNPALNTALAAIKTLIQQEAAEDDFDPSDVAWLAGIGNQIKDWAAMESWEASFDDDLTLAVEPLTSALAMPNKEKRRVFYSSQHRENVRQALDGLQLALAGDAEGPASVDTEESDTAAVTGAGPLNDSELMQDGDESVSEPKPTGDDGVDPAEHKSAPTDVNPPAEEQTVPHATDIEGVKPTFRTPTVKQDGPSVQVTARNGGNPEPFSKDAEPDSTKALEADSTKAMMANLTKAVDDLRGELLQKAAEVDELKAAVDEMGKRAQPGGPFVGGVLNKTFEVNKSVPAQDTLSPEVIDQMTKLQALSKSGVRELAVSAKQQLDVLIKRHIPNNE